MYALCLSLIGIAHPPHALCVDMRAPGCSEATPLLPLPPRPICPRPPCPSQGRRGGPQTKPSPGSQPAAWWDPAQHPLLAAARLASRCTRNAGCCLQPCLTLPPGGRGGAHRRAAGPRPSPFHPPAAPFPVHFLSPPVHALPSLCSTLVNGAHPVRRTPTPRQHSGGGGSRAPALCPTRRRCRRPLFVHGACKAQSFPCAQYKS
jgi:hypothetical protein